MNKSEKCEKCNCRYYYKPDVYAELGCCFPYLDYSADDMEYREEVCWEEKEIVCRLTKGKLGYLATMAKVYLKEHEHVNEDFEEYQKTAHEISQAMNIGDYIALDKNGNVFLVHDDVQI